MQAGAGVAGLGVTMGWRVDDAAQRAALEAALEGEPHVDQARVPNHRVAYPALEPGLPERTYYVRTPTRFSTTAVCPPCSPV